MKLIDKIDDSFFQKIDFEELEDVKKIISDVKNNGDSSLLNYCLKFGEGNFKNANDFIVTKKEIDDALNSIDKKLLKSIEFAICNVKKFALAQRSKIDDLKINIGNSVLGHKIIPIENVLCYVPGGNFSLVSSVIMGVTPAFVAGVKNIYVTSPKISKEIIATAALTGAHKIFKIGGAQAISAFAYGTETIPKVDKITGPGNKYVTYAKKFVYGECGIDFLAGPSEILIVADNTANADFVATDILAQCEHDKNARAYLISNDKNYIKKVIEIAKNNVEKYGENAVFAFNNSIAVAVDKLDEAVEISNKKAPEHLQLMFKGAENFADKFINYGSLFIGDNSPVVFGDYCSGTNHVLPTNQVARYSGGLSVFDFLKIQTFQQIDSVYAKILSENTSALADCEGLLAHKKASELRG